MVQCRICGQEFTSLKERIADHLAPRRVWVSRRARCQRVVLSLFATISANIEPTREGNPIRALVEKMMDNQ